MHGFQDLKRPLGILYLTSDMEVTDSVKEVRTCIYIYIYICMYVCIYSLIHMYPSLHDSYIINCARHAPFSFNMIAISNMLACIVSKRWMQ